MNHDILSIKPSKIQVLPAVLRDARFRALTAYLVVAGYEVNETRCIGVTLANPCDANVEPLKKFCDDVCLESALVKIPWATGDRSILFIRAVGNWSPTCLRNA